MKRVVLAALTLCAVLAAPGVCNADDLRYYRPVRSNFGLALGTPAGVNLFVSYYSAVGIGWRGSGFFVPGSKDRHLGGFQFNLLWKLSEGSDFIVDASFVAGYYSYKTDEKTDTWRYGGIATAVRWKALFAEAAITAGDGTFESPQPGFQLGVVLRTERRRH
jgi:hypothetical protein